MAETAKSIQKTTDLFSKDSKEENVPKSINSIHNKAFILHNILLKCQEIKIQQLLQILAFHRLKGLSDF